MIEIIKSPEYENDDYLIKCSCINLYENIDYFINIDKYTKLKDQQFSNFDTDNKIWIDFISENPEEGLRGSLKNIKKTSALNGSIYTVTVSNRNYSEEINDFNNSYNNIIDTIVQLMSNKCTKNSRRIFLRFANSFDEYIKSFTDSPWIDTTCLIGIHYLQNHCKLIFRASDIKNEMIPDILTIYKYFIYPVYKKNFSLSISIYSSTAQNYKFFNDTIKKLEMMLFDKIRTVK